MTHNSVFLYTHLDDTGAATAAHTIKRKQFMHIITHTFYMFSLGGDDAECSNWDWEWPEIGIEMERSIRRTLNITAFSCLSKAGGVVSIYFIVRQRMYSIKPTPLYWFGCVQISHIIYCSGSIFVQTACASE